MSSDRVESNIPAIFSKYIRDCNPLLWLKFVRLLGVSNNDIASLIGAGDRFGDHEMKYRMLEKWKSIVGLKRDDEYSYYLKKTLNEVNTRSQHDIVYDYHRLNENIKFARAAYKFIDKHSSVWTQVMHHRLHEADFKNITDMYHRDQLEMKYQMILRIQDFQGTNFTDMLDFLGRDYNRVNN